MQLVAAVSGVLLTQSIIVLSSDAADVANVLYSGRSSNSARVCVQKRQWLLSGLKDEEFIPEMGTPFG